MGGGGIAHLELHRGADRDLVVDRHRTHRTVCSEHAADQEVAAAVFEPGLVDHPADVQPRGHQSLFGIGARFDQFVDAFDCASAADLVQHVAFGAGDDEWLADRSTTL